MQGFLQEGANPGKHLREINAVNMSGLGEELGFFGVRPDSRFFPPSEGVRSCPEVFAKPLEPIDLQAAAALGAAA